MGLTISIDKLNGNKHPEWDPDRIVGDKDIADFLEYAWPNERADQDINWDYFRPKNLDKLLAHKILKQFPYPDRFKKIITILKNNPDYWLYISR